MKIKTAIAGASGYSGEELVKLLLHHPSVDLCAITSRQYAGQSLAQVFPKFAHLPGAGKLLFSEPNAASLAEKAEVIFLALPHGVSAELAVPLIAADRRVIDLSADFRLKSAQVYREFYGHEHPAPQLLAESVYGLPELYRSRLPQARLVASPGCYPTSILLPLIPLLREQVIQREGIVVNSLSGVSGAGRKAELDYLFVECNESMRPYGVPKHRHLSEIEQELSAAAGQGMIIQFTPHLIPLNRGMITTICARPGESIQDAPGLDRLKKRLAAIFQEAYGNEPFIRLLPDKALPDSKNVSGTNVVEIAWRLDARTGNLLLMSALDNLVKGASGQAVQCFNALYGLPETAGLL
jgi:N-acetyl-gamma-glutamyl-phosphate reductase